MKPENLEIASQPAIVEKPSETKVRVFYSWQSDLPSEVSKKLIRNALNDAAQNINKAHELNAHVIPDEATRDTTGSPDIANTIFEKIKAADIFVCDLSKVAESHDGRRKYCNSNVAIELGYAVRVLGWERILILFNKAYGRFPEDLPFDIQRRRAQDYECLFEPEAENPKKPTETCSRNISNQTGRLCQELKTGLKAIIQANPPRPEELDKKTPEAVRRERDVRQLKEVFYYINLKMLDEFIDRLCESRITYVGVCFYERLEMLLVRPDYHIYDEELNRYILKFIQSWKASMNFLNGMKTTKNGEEAFFYLPGDVFQSQEQEKQFRFTAEQALILRRSLDQLLDFVRDNYLEIDLKVCGKEALEKYRSEEAIVKAYSR